MLRNVTINQVKPSDKSIKLAGGEGLYLLVMPNGSRYWRYDYRFEGKRKTLAIGVYPRVTIAKAYAEHARAMKMLNDGCDPAGAKAKEKELAKIKLETFEDIYKKWYEKKLPEWADATARKWREGMELMRPYIGHIGIADLRPSEIVNMLEQVEKRSPYMSYKCRQFATSIVRYSIQIGARPSGNFVDLRGVLKRIPESHFPSPVNNGVLEKQQQIDAVVGNLLNKIDAFAVRNVSGVALQLQTMFFVRPGELVTMKWSEIKEDVKEWHSYLPKTKVKHIVPISLQAQRILAKLKESKGDSDYVFASRVSESGHIHRDALSKGLRTLELRGVIVPHGFRHLGSTLLNELGFNRDVIERQLSHKDSSVRGIYNQAQYLPERKRMMQKWADHLDFLKENAPKIGASS